MARKAKSVTTTTEPKVRRTPEQQIADLQAKIAAVERRAAAKQVKAAPEGKPFLVAIRAVDKAIVAAASNAELRHALESARATMGEQMIRMGMRAPVTRRKIEAA